MRRFERRDLQDRVAIFDVVDQPFLDGAAEFLPECLVAVGVAGHHVLHRRQHLLTRRLRISWIWRSFWRISRDTLSDRSWASTTPLTKRRYSGMSSSQSSMMKTRLTYSCTPRLRPRMNRSNGARDGMNSSAWYSNVPSA